MNENLKRTDSTPLADRYRRLAETVWREGLAYPAAIERSPLGALPAAMKVSPQSTPEETMEHGDLVHLGERRRDLPSMHDGPVLALESLTASSLRLVGSSYFAMVATCDALRAEYLTEGIGPLRERAEMRAAPDPLRIGRGRAAALGITVAVVRVDGTTRSLLIGRRRADLAADPGLWDVAPSGMVEPGDFEADDALTRGAIREVEEELGLTLARSDLRVLGIGFDLLRLRPELVLSIEISKDESDRELSTSEFDSTYWLVIAPGTLARFWTSHPPDSLTPSAAASIALLEGAQLRTPDS